MMWLSVLISFFRCESISTLDHVSLFAHTLQLFCSQFAQRMHTVLQTVFNTVLNKVLHTGFLHRFAHSFAQSLQTVWTQLALYLYNDCSSNLIYWSLKINEKSWKNYKSCLLIELNSIVFQAILITIKLFEREGIASPDVEQRINRLMRSYLSLKNNEVLSLVGVFWSQPRG